MCDQVRDDEDEDWWPGTVVGFSEPGGAPLVRKDGWDEDFEWAFTRALPGGGGGLGSAGGSPALSVRKLLSATASSTRGFLDGLSLGLDRLTGGDTGDPGGRGETSGAAAGSAGSAGTPVARRVGPRAAGPGAGTPVAVAVAAAAAGPTGAEASAAPGAGWACGPCGFPNADPAAGWCAMCGEDRAEDRAEATAGAAPPLALAFAAAAADAVTPSAREDEEEEEDEGTLGAGSADNAVTAASREGPPKDSASDESASEEEPSSDDDSDASDDSDDWSEGEPAWAEHADTDAFKGENALVVPLLTAGAARALAQRRGFGGFAVSRKTTYFRARAGRDLLARAAPRLAPTHAPPPLFSSGPHGPSATRPRLPPPSWWPRFSCASVGPPPHPSHSRFISC